MRCATQLNSHRHFALLLVGTLISIPGQSGICQTSSVQPAGITAGATSSAQQMPSYEVATIKPAGENDYAPTLRAYIQRAYAIPINSKGWVVGPEWINTARYLIRGKPSESVQKAMQAMTIADRLKQDHRMQQALLAERFNLQAHFETREMPVYELVVAKGGSKLKESPDSSKAVLSVGTNTLRGRAVTMENLLGGLESLPDMGGRVVIDKSGLTGRYDFSMSWTPLEESSSPDAVGATLPTAIKEQLGLRLILTKALGQVLVIDHIQPPSGN